MKELFLIACCGIALSSFSQKSDTTYYKNQYCQKEVAQKKGKYWKIISENDDGSVTTKVIEVLTKRTYSSNSLLGEEPVGIWYIAGVDTTYQADYNFNVTYNQSSCTQIDQKFVKGPFFDDPSIAYTAPVIKNSNSSIIEYVNIAGFYPDFSKQGRVQIAFNISTDGNITDIVVINGVSIALDKEAVRILKSIELSEPARLNGKAIQLCTTCIKLFSMG